VYVYVYVCVRDCVCSACVYVYVAGHGLSHHREYQFFIPTMDTFSFRSNFQRSYGVATISKLLKMIGLFCKRAL